MARGVGWGGGGHMCACMCCTSWSAGCHNVVFDSENRLVMLFPSGCVCAAGCPCPTTSLCQTSTWSRRTGCSFCVGRQAHKTPTSRDAWHCLTHGRALDTPMCKCAFGHTLLILSRMSHPAGYLRRVPVAAHKQASLVGVLGSSVHVTGCVLHLNSVCSFTSVIGCAYRSACVHLQGQHDP